MLPLVTTLCQFLTYGSELLVVLLFSLLILLIQLYQLFWERFLLILQVVLLVKEFFFVSQIVVHQFAMLVNKAKFIFCSFNLRLAILHKRCIRTTTFQLIHLLLLQLQQFSISIFLANLGFGFDSGYALSMHLHILSLCIIIFPFSTIQLFLLIGIHLLKSRLCGW